MKGNWSIKQRWKKSSWVEKASLIAFIVFLVLWASLRVCVAFLGVDVYADTTSVATYASEVRNQMVADYADETYGTSGGGYYTISDLMTNADPDHPNLYVINESTFSQLTSSAKTDFMSDLNTAASKVVSNSTSGVYTTETQTNWYKVLQTQDGVGSKFMNVLLENVKPDFVTANKWLAPLTSFISILLGVGAIGIMALIALVTVADIAYIALPPFRNFVSDDEKGGIPKSKLISFDAIFAVQKAEGDSGDATPKMALGIYLRRRILTLCLLGICLLYLVAGKIFAFVGMVLDLVSGIV